MKALRGFSLVELMVALVLSGVLMAGMAKIFATSISTMHRTGELMGAQRRNRWILNEFGDDLRMAGHTDGFRSGAVPTPLPEQPFMIVPGDNGTGGDRDQIDLFMNEPVQELSVSAPLVQGNTSVSLTSIGGGSLQVQSGDLLIIKDGAQAEYGYAGVVSSGSVTLMDEAAQQANPLAAYMKYGSAALQFPHKSGEAVTVLRPCQLIHYGIEDRALDPSDSTVLIPCLVRKQALFGTGAQAGWGAIAGEVVAENVSALRLELSVDGGVHWERGTTWAATVALANSRLDAANQIDPSTFWFKRVPAIVKIEIRSRTPVARTEYSATTGSVAYKERTQVLVVAPRNFASPL